MWPFKKREMKLRHMARGKQDVKNLLALFAILEEIRQIINDREGQTLLRICETIDKTQYEIVNEVFDDPDLSREFTELAVVANLKKRFDQLKAKTES